MVNKRVEVVGVVKEAQVTAKMYPECPELLKV